MHSFFGSFNSGPPIPGNSWNSIPSFLFLTGFLFDVPAIPRVRSGNGIPFSFCSFPFLPSSCLGECWQNLICPCGILSHFFLSYVGFNMMYIFEYIPFKDSFYYLTRHHHLLQLATHNTTCIISSSRGCSAPFAGLFFLDDLTVAQRVQVTKKTDLEQEIVTLSQLHVINVQ